MFTVLVELMISLVVCGALAYFLFLSGTMDEELGGGGSGEEALRDDARYGPSEDTSPRQGGASNGGEGGKPRSALDRLVQCALQVNALVQRSTSWSPRRAATAHEAMHKLSRDRTRRAYSRGSSGATASASPPALYPRGANEVVHDGTARGLAGGSRRVEADAAAAAMRGSMDHFVLPDGTAVASAAPPLRASRNEACSESAHWCACVTRWLALWFIGGGSVRTAVWQARCELLLAELVRRASWHWAAALRLRDAAPRRAVGADLDDTLRSASHVAGGGLDARAGAARPLVRLLRLRLGPARTLARVPSSAGRAAPLSVRTVEAAPWQSQASAHKLALLHVRRRLQGQMESARSTRRQAAGLYGVGNEQASSFGRGAAMAPSSRPHLSAPSLARMTVHGQAGGGGSSGHGAGPLPAVGIVLPQLTDDVTSIEVTGSHRMYEKVRAGAGGCRGGGDAEQRAASPLTPVPPTLRCFHLPLCYEDGHFMLSLGCALPLAWLLLPARLCIPSDALALHCTVTVRRVRFHGAVHVAFAGAVLELSFPTAPQFDAEVEVTVPSAASSAASSTSCLAEPNAKVQELVSLAIQRAVRGLLYPRVLQARLQWGSAADAAVSRQAGLANNNSNSKTHHALPYYASDRTETQAPWQGWLSWRRTTATLPLYKVHAS